MAPWSQTRRILSSLVHPFTVHNARLRKRFFLKNVPDEKQAKSAFHVSHLGTSGCGEPLLLQRLRASVMWCDYCLAIRVNNSGSLVFRVCAANLGTEIDSPDSGWLALQPYFYQPRRTSSSASETRCESPSGGSASLLQWMACISVVFMRFAAMNYRAFKSWVSSCPACCREPMTRKTSGGRGAAGRFDA